MLTREGQNLTKGSKCYFPVYIAGANLSVGDLHFSQGDGELSFCGAIEMVSIASSLVVWFGDRAHLLCVQAGVIQLKCSVIKNGIEKFGLKQPIFLVRSLTFVQYCCAIFHGD